MTMPLPGSWDELSISEQLLIDEICNTFEKALGANQQPRIEAYLSLAGERLQPLLLQELTVLDSHHRGRQPVAPCEPGQEPARLGDYELLDEIARGGMGVVYRARDTRLNRHVAVKVILSGELASAKERQRFQVEAEATAKLDHPHIVPVYEVGEQHGRSYLVMKLIEGGSLAQWIAKARWQPADAIPTQQARIAQVMAIVARAVHYAHQRGILHRDIKPSNILLQLPYDSRPSAVNSLQSASPIITDFGLARRLDETTPLTESDALIGTPCYIAPEALDGGAKNVSTAVDVYGLGAVLYELLTGQPPFRAASPLEVLRKVAGEEPVAPRRIQPRLARDLETICLKCLNKDPQARYGTAADLAADLERFERGQPIAARPASSLARIRMWRRRNPKLALMAGTITVLLLFLLVISGAAAVIYRHQRDLLDAQAKTLEHERGRGADRLAGALFEKARGGRLGGQMGRRFTGLQSLADAAGILRTLELPPDTLASRLLELRHEAVACLALPDFRIVKTWSMPAPKKGNNLYDFDRQLLHYAREEDDGAVTVWSANENQQIARLHRPGGEVQGLQLSPDGGLLAVSYSGLNNVGFCIWDVNGSSLTLESPLPTAGNAMAFSPDKQHFAMASPDGTIHIFKLSSKQEIKAFAGIADPTDVEFAPDQQMLAVSSSSGSLRICEWPSGKVLRDFSHESKVYEISWEPEGNYIAAACHDTCAHVWEIKSGQRKAVLKGHKQVVVRVAFHPSGEFLATAGWDGTTRLWHLFSQQELLRTNGTLCRFNSNGTQLSVGRVGELGIWEVNLAPECRLLTGQDRPAKHACNSACSPDGRLLATCGLDGLRLWDRSAWKQIGFVDLRGATSVAFHPLAGRLFTASAFGLHDWPVLRSVEPQAELIRLGSPRRVQVPGIPAPHRIIFSPKDGTLVANSDTGQKHVVILPADRSPPVTVEWKYDLRFTAVSPDGKWLAVGPWVGSGISLWDVSTGALVKELPSAGATSVAFSPDGKWLAGCDNDVVAFWHVGSWRLSHVYAAAGLGYLTFSPDGGILAVAKILATREPNAVHLVHPATGRLIAKLENTPAPTQIEEEISFSPDGSQLIVPHWNDGVFAVWDLRRIREQLQGMGLDWDQPSYPEAPPVPAKPLRMQIQRGSLLIDKCMDEHNWQAAISAADKEIAAAPHDAELFRARAEARLQLNQYDQALTDFDQFFTLYPTDAHAFNMFAWKVAAPPLPNAGLTARALAWANQAVALAPTNGNYWNTLGVALYRNQKWSESIAALKKSVELSQGYRFGWNAFFLAMAHWQLRETDAARNWYDKAVVWMQNNDPTYFRTRQFLEETDKLMGTKKP